MCWTYGDVSLVYIHVVSPASLHFSLWPLGRNSRQSTLLRGRRVCAKSRTKRGGPEKAVCHLHLPCQQGANCRYCPMPPRLSLLSALRSFDRLRKPRRATLEKRPAMSLTCLQQDTRGVRARDSLPASAYVSIRQHTSAYISIRQHTSASFSVTLTSDTLYTSLSHARCSCCGIGSSLAR
jgi:hypothetical protein